MYRYAWQVISAWGDMNSGVCDTFKEAQAALSAWFGDGAHDDVSYSIQRVVAVGTPHRRDREPYDSELAYNALMNKEHNRK